MSSIMMSSPDYFYPNRMRRILLLAMEEILGYSGVTKVLDLARLTEYIDQSPAYKHDLKFPSEHIGRLQVALENAFGPRAGRGLSIRVGRACLKYGMREFGPELGMTDLTFRLLPLQTRLKVGMEAIARIFNKLSDQSVRIEADGKHIYWHIEHCPLCRGRRAESVSCTLAAGILQEALYLVSGGKSFQVEGKNCNTCEGGPCTIMIDPTPIV